MNSRFTVLSACALIPVFAEDEAKSPLSDKDKSVNIGGIVYPSEQMDDFGSKRKAELIAEKIRILEETSQRSIDFSDVSMFDIIGKALITESNEVWHAVMEELTERPDEAKAAISEYFEIIDPNSPSKLPSVQLLLTRLPQISGVLGIKYQREIVKRALFHSVAPDYDPVLLADNGILRYLENSQHDETAVLDRLLAQGRLEAGSDLESNWRNRLASKGAPRPRARDMLNGPSEADALKDLRHREFDNGGRPSPEGVNLFSRDRDNRRKSRVEKKLGKTESTPNNILWIIAGVLVVGILTLLIKIVKGSSA